MALLWKLSKAPCPKIQSSTDYCWETVDGQLKPVFCVNNLAQEAGPARNLTKEI